MYSCILNLCCLLKTQYSQYSVPSHRHFAVIQLNSTFNTSFYKAAGMFDAMAAKVELALITDLSLSWNYAEGIVMFLDTNCVLRASTDIPPRGPCKVDELGRHCINWISLVKIGIKGGRGGRRSSRENINWYF